MKNKQEIPAVILADVKVFDYLKEKVGERKTRTEAYSDLLDKSLAGFISPFLRKQDYDLQPCQCHVTISDLATEWHWHRATVRSFLETLEAFGQLKRTRLAKSIVITMPVQSGQSSAAFVVQRQPDFAIQLQEVLSDWIVGKTTSADVGNLCGQVVRQAMTGMTGYESRHCPDSHIDTASVHAGKQEDEIVRPPWDVLPTLPCNEYCANRDSMTARRSLSSFVMTSMKNGSLSSKHPKSLRSLFSIPKRVRRP